MRRVHVFVYGLVQGVFFRYNTKKVADHFKVKGFVRNLDDKVEAVFEGSEASIDKVLDFCGKGPAGAVVERLEVYEEKFKDEFEGFEMLE